MLSFQDGLSQKELEKELCYEITGGWSWCVCVCVCVCVCYVHNIIHCYNGHSTGYCKSSTSNRSEL